MLRVRALARVLPLVLLPSALTLTGVAPVQAVQPVQPQQSVQADQSAYRWSSWDTSLPRATYSTNVATGPGGVVFTFGGFGPERAGEEPTTSARTMQWTGTHWTGQAPATTPLSRTDAVLVGDGEHDAVLVGGWHQAADGSRPIQDTWTWNGTDWTRAQGAPLPTFGPAAAMYGDGDVVLFGGRSWYDGSRHPDTWVWDGERWDLRDPAHSPPARSSASAAVDAHGDVVMYGGDGASGPLTDTWVWDGTDWTERTTAHSPGATRGAAFALSGSGRDLLIDPISETAWSWDGTDWSRAPYPAVPAEAEVLGLARDAAGRLVAPASRLEEPPTTAVWSADEATAVEAVSGPVRAPGSTAFPSRLVARAQDDSGHGRLAGTSVTFTLPSSGPSATFPGGARTATVVSDAAGLATSPVLTAGSAPGTFTARATVPTDHRSAQWTLTVDPPGVTVAAIKGTDGQLWVRTSTERNWRSLGGALRDTPAVVARGGTAYYIARNERDRLVVRTDALGWQRLSPPGQRCLEPGATVDGRVLVVACRGTDDRLYAGKVAFPRSGLPALTAMKDLGGDLQSGPAVISTDGRAAYLVRDRRTPGQTRLYQEGSGWRGDVLGCGAAPAIAKASGVTYRACQERSDPGVEPWMEVAYRYPGGPAPHGSGYPGDMRGRVGLAVSADGRTATAYARDAAGAVMRTTLDARRGTPQAWTPLGGHRTTQGVGAAQLSG